MANLPSAANTAARVQRIGTSSVSQAAKPAAAKPAAAAAVVSNSRIGQTRNNTNVITANKKQVYSNGRLVGNYSSVDAARRAAAEFTTLKKNVAGNIDGSTFRLVQSAKAAGRPILNANAAKPMASGFKTQLAPAGPQTQRAITPLALRDGRSIAPASISDAPDLPGAQPRAGMDSANSMASGNFGESRPVLYGTGANQPDIRDSFSVNEPKQPKSLQDIRQEELTRYQSAIDATQSIYTTELQRLSQQGAAIKAEASSQAVGAGLAGSPFQSTIEASVQAGTDQKKQELTDRRTASVTNLLLESGNRANELYQSGLDEYQQERSFYVDERDKAMANQQAQAKARKDAANSTLSNLAKSGYSVDEIPRQQYQKLLADTGMSDFEARAIWASATPAANATYTTQNGFMVGTYFDPITRKPVVITTPLPEELEGGVAPDLQTLKLADGSVIFYDAKQPFNVDGSLRTINYQGGDIRDSETASLPASFKEWELAGGVEGTGKSFADFIAKDGSVAEDNTLLTQTEAANLGVVYGTTRAQAAAMSVVPQKELSSEMLKLQENVRSGLDSLKSIEDTLDGGRRSILANRGYKAAEKNLVDVMIRIRSGGAATKDEEKTFKSLLPGVRDSKKIAAGKLASMKSLLEGIAQKGIRPPTVDLPSIKFDKPYESTGAIIQDYPELEPSAKSLKESDYNDSEVLEYLNTKHGAQSFSKVGGDTNQAAVTKLAMAFKPGSKGGQCGRFVNQHTGLGMGNSVESKLAKIDPKIGKTVAVQPGDVFVSRYSWTGHTGFIKRVIPKSNGTFDYEVIDSNYGLDEKVKVHIMPGSKMAGFARAPLTI